MKILMLSLICFCLVNCSGESEPAKLEIPDSFNFMLEQRNSRIIKGSEEAIRIKLGDITSGKVEVKVSGESEDGEGTIYMDRVMSEGDRGSFDYHGTLYTLEIEQLENKLFGEDFAQIALFEGKHEDKFQPELE